MIVIVEKVFEVKVVDWKLEFDSPVMGACQETEVFKKTHGPYKRISTAKRIMSDLIKKYQANGCKIDKKESKNTHRTKLYGTNSDIILWIEEKIISEKPV